MADLKNTIKTPTSSLRPTPAQPSPIGPPVPTPLPKQGAQTTYNYPSNTGAVSNVPVPASNQEKPGSTYNGAGYAVNPATGKTTAVTYPTTTPGTSQPAPSTAKAAPEPPESMNIADRDVWARNNGYTGWNDYMDNKGRSTPSAPSEPKIDINDVRGVATTVPGASEFLNDADMENILRKYADTTRSRANDLASEIENAARENAEREYKDVMSALSVQKGEATAVSENQRERALKQKALTEEGLTDKEQTELSSIESQKGTFQEDVTIQRDNLASQWRDLSMETQRIMRARGVQDSEFASSKESKLLLDFNKGLRAIATQEVGALADFAEAVTETNKFYTRQKGQLQLDFDNAMNDIDTWVRQKVQAIQAQENTALTKKLNDVRSALTQAKQLKINVEQTIADKELAMGQWLVQMDYNYKTAVATAALGKVGDATAKISEAKNLFSLTKTILDNGGEVKYDSKQKQWFVHGINPASGEDVYSPITAGGAQNALSTIVADQIKTQTAGNPFAKIDSNLYGNIQQNVYDAAGAGDQAPSMASNTSTQSSPVQNGILSGLLQKIGL